MRVERDFEDVNEAGVERARIRSDLDASTTQGGTIGPALFKEMVFLIKILQINCNKS